MLCTCISEMMARKFRKTLDSHRQVLTVSKAKSSSLCKGSAVMNGLFNKGLVTPRLESKVRLSAPVGYEVWACCPTGVFDVEDSGKVVVARPWHCTACLRCTTGRAVTVETPVNAAAAPDWLVEVESYGAETPRQLLEQCFDCLRETRRARPGPAAALYDSSSSSSSPAYDPSSPLNGACFALVPTVITHNGACFALVPTVITRNGACFALVPTVVTCNSACFAVPLKKLRG
eukprot:g3617.t1